MPPRSAAHALEQLRQDNPQLADHVHLGGQLDMFPKLAVEAGRKDHDWAFVGIDLSGGTVGRFQCRVCHHWMERRGSRGEEKIFYFSPDGSTVLEVRPICEGEAQELPAAAHDYKRQYVAQEVARGHAGDHVCHATDCKTPIPPAYAMCRPHWRLVPYPIKRRIWSTHRPGQERDKRPSRAYLSALNDAVAAVVKATEGRNAG